MAYYIDLNKITINQLKNKLKTGNLLPSWMILREDIDHRFNILTKHNIKNMFDLQTTLKNRNKALEFAKKSGIPEQYLIVLRRVLNGYQPKPNNLKDFPDVSGNILIRLEAIGIKNTLQLYEEILTSESRKEFSLKTGMDIQDILRLTKYSDISRIRWVNHTFAYVLVETGYDTAQKIASSKPTEMYSDIKNMNDERKIYKANIGVNDMKLVIDSAKELDFDIEYD